MRPGVCFFAVAVTAGGRAPLQTNERYALLRVRRVGALGLGARKALLFGGFPIPLENMEENDAFCAFAQCSSIPCFSLLLRGRRQLPPAGEVRRPRRGQGVELWLV